MRTLIIFLVLVSISYGADEIVKIEDIPVKTEDRVASVKTVHATRLIKGKTINTSQNKWSWRAVHQNGKLKMEPFWSNCKTWTMHGMIEAPTLAELKAKLAELNIEINAEQQEKIDELKAVPTKAAVEIIK